LQALRLWAISIIARHLLQASVYTGRGDKGETSLYGAKRVQKDDPRVEAYGAIDELNSLLGVVVAGSVDKKLNVSLVEVQRLLFVAGADAASELRSAAPIPRISVADTQKLETMIKELLADLPTLKNFILPGGTSTAAMLQLARSVCRRTERRILSASKSTEMNP
jgi:cob(I)alamin adenosyltransferase